MQIRDDAPPTARVGDQKQVLRRIPRVLALVVAILLITGIALRETLQPSERLLDANQQLAQSEVSSRIMMQQLDEVFDNLASTLQERGELTEQDIALLTTWKNYDEQFLVSTRDNPSVRYMRANARFRLGLIEQLLGDHAVAVLHFQQAAEILDVLVAESPEIPSYQGELVFCWINASENALKTGEWQLASECVAELERQLSRPALSNQADIRGYRQILGSLKSALATRR